MNKTQKCKVQPEEVPPMEPAIDYFMPIYFLYHTSHVFENEHQPYMLLFIYYVTIFQGKTCGYTTP